MLLRYLAATAATAFIRNAHVVQTKIYRFSSVVVAKNPYNWQTTLRLSRKSPLTFYEAHAGMSQ